MRSKILAILLLSMSLMLSGCGQTPAESTPEVTADVTDSPSVSLSDLDITQCVSSVTYKGLTAEKQDADLTDAEFEYALYMLQSQYATTDAITDRTVAEGDVVNLSYIAMSDGTLVTDFWQDNAEITVGDGLTFPEFEQALVGKPCGEEFSVDVTLPEDLSEEYGGQDLQVMVTIHYIESDPVLPELTDEFVSSLDEWDCDTAAEFKDVYRSYLEQQKAAYYENAYKDALWNQVIESAEITDQGEAYVSSYCQEQEAICRSDAQTYGMTTDELATYSGYENEAALLEAVREFAEEEAKTLLVMTYIANAEEIAYTEDEYYDAVDDYAQYLGFETTADMINQYGLSYIEETVGSGLLYDLVLDYVATNAA